MIHETQIGTFINFEATKSDVKEFVSIFFFCISIGYESVKKEIINLAHTLSFPKNYHFLPPDTLAKVSVSRGKK